MLHKNIYLVGFMGCGKTTIGTKLGTYTGRNFLDIDTLITEEAGMAIPTIFEQEGEGFFRALETKILYDTKAFRAAVIATGGGIVEKEVNRLFLKEEEVIYLKLPFEVLYNRIQGDSNRPLVTTKEALRARYVKREKWYEAVASEIVNCEGHTPYSLSKYLAERMNR